MPDCVQLCKSYLEIIAAQRINRQVFGAINAQPRDKLV